MPDTGSAYGGKHTGETAIEAARLARAAKRPVKLVWTREEEFSWAYFRPAGVIEVTSAVRKDGTITGWEFHNYNSGTAGIRTYYDVPNQRIQFHPTRSPLRQGSYRGLAASANHFARESFMDELAHSVNLDPLEFRRKNLKDERLRAVFEAAARQFGWGRPKTAAGQGFGMGGGYEKLGNVATFVEIAIEPKSGAVKVVRMVTAFECGAIVNNPDTKPANGRKSDAELIVQAESLNRMGRSLRDQGFQLRVHHHTAELAEDAREWRHILRNTDSQFVTLCLDLEHAFHAGVDPNALIKEAGSRVTEIHLRNKKKETPLEALEDGDIDHHSIAATLKNLKLEPLVVIELAYHADTVITRPLKEDLRLSRIYAEKVFAL